MTKLLLIGNKIIQLNKTIFYTYVIQKYIVTNDQLHYQKSIIIHNLVTAKWI